MSSIPLPQEALSCLAMEKAGGKGLPSNRVSSLWNQVYNLPEIEPELEVMSTDERTRKKWCLHVSIYIDLYTFVSPDICVYLLVCGMCVHLNQWLRPYQVQGGYCVLSIPRGRCCLKQVFSCHQDLGILLFFITKRLNSF